MCKLMGCSNAPMGENQIADFYNRQGSFNPHASGFLSIDKSEAWIAKAPVRGSQFWMDNRGKILDHAEAGLCLYHVRYATNGSPENNDNNHPLLAMENGKLQAAIVHNGVVIPPEWIEASGKCDSEQLLRHWLTDGPLAWAKFTGWASVLLWEGGTLFAYTNHSSLNWRVAGDGIQFDQVSHGQGWQPLPNNIVYAVNGITLEKVEAVNFSNKPTASRQYKLPIPYTEHSAST